jgi:hypothetical protein
VVEHELLEVVEGGETKWKRKENLSVPAQIENTIIGYTVKLYCQQNLLLQQPN